MIPGLGQRLLAMHGRWLYRRQLVDPLLDVSRDCHRRGQSTSGALDGSFAGHQVISVLNRGQRDWGGRTVVGRVDERRTVDGPVA